ncbi:hypothetical protein [Shinella sp.]|uniref:hypothetical protein n=1 Tax=Shinella sp. TaxID=1870904 RepID=UPI00258D8611|nr:hypothetical protein [Shinella sp.]MCW5706768.1 hypothetical protein [Shinella sp.]
MTQENPIYLPDLMCEVHSLTYDFPTRTGRLNMAQGNATDMAGAIALFERIDPNVELISTFAGDVPDTIYRRHRKDWIAQ